MNTTMINGGVNSSIFHRIGEMTNNVEIVDSGRIGNALIHARIPILLG